jgi:Bacteriocin-protection, YdeI or OmpD-Associated/Domain of unknown function (DUF1905)
MSNRKLRFRGPIEIRGINPFVLVSAQQAARLKPDWRKPMPVSIQVNAKPDVPWRINMMPAGDGSFFLYLHERVRKASTTGVGDIVTVTIAFDDGYKGGPLDPMPGWFDNALKLNPSARRGWNKLPPSRQKEILRYLVRLKSAEAQQRNMRSALGVLAGGKARFMGRAWEGGR